MFRYLVTFFFLLLFFATNALAQVSFTNMPPSNKNTRIYSDRFDIKRPALSIRGFDSDNIQDYPDNGNNYKYLQDKINNRLNKNSIYLELFGNGLFYSLNYERLVKENLSVRFGASYFPKVGSGFISFERHITLPILINYQLRMTDNILLETGLGSTLVFLNTDSNISLTSSIGLKSIDSKTGKFFKISLTPYIENINKNNNLNLSLGLSFGKTF